MKRFVRPAVAAILGHVDHGKTTLLDCLRRTRVAQSEVGGITQAIGAFSVTLKQNERMTFLDTPGHAAFSAMRTRGAQLTDIAVLAVALDDGVMPQTKESIQAAAEANVPVVVALTKADIAAERADAVCRQLLAHGLHTESLGGDTQAVAVSAKSNTGIGAFLDALSAQASLLDLATDIECPAKGVIVEVAHRTGLGQTATVLLRQGVLRLGAILQSGGAYCRVRAMIDDSGNRVNQAMPSDPVVVAGWRSSPMPGSVVAEVTNMGESCSIRPDAPAENISFQVALPIDAKGRPVVNILVRTDVVGAAEAVGKLLAGIPQDKVCLNVISCAAGSVSYADSVQANHGHIVTFGAARLPTFDGAPQYPHFDIIYRLEEHVRSLMLAALPDVFDDRPLGTATIQAVYDLGKRGRVLGCLVNDGAIYKSHDQGDVFARVLQLGTPIVTDASVESLKRQQQDITVALNGTECGVLLSRHADNIRPGDSLQCHVRIPVPKSLD